MQLLGQPPTAILNLCGRATPPQAGVELVVQFSADSLRVGIAVDAGGPLQAVRGRTFAPVPPMTRPASTADWRTASTSSRWMPGISTVGAK